ncbi:RHS repeat-associated protein [Streptomyces sp. TLI_235]|nr:ricin-type beta-trefoil lectin domain protein [Streptomyces sp. TLI_235]PBC69771.1 RHS repeat-associated protein [Streptomyces sp. TLI_235]
MLRTSQTYDDATGRVTTSRVALQESDANPISQTTYGYDQAGSLTSSSELQSSGSTDVTYDTQCFRHDGLNRLTEAWTDNRGVSTPTAGQVSHCTNDAPSWVTLGGPAPYWQSYQYDQLGDRTQQVRHDVAGDTSRDVTQTSAYGSDGRTAAAKPNQLTSVTSKTGLPTTTFTSGMPAADGSTLCLDARDGLAGDGNAVQTAGCNGTPAQRWTRPGDGTLRVLGKCAMPGLGGNGGNGIGIELHTCDGSAGQKWQDGASGMLVYAPSGRCLEIPGWNQTPGTQVGLWDCIGGHSNQQWTGTLNPPTGPSYTSTLTPQYDQQGSTTSRSTVYAGTLPSSVATGGTPNCLDAAGASSANGTAVQSWTCNRTGAQDWTLGTDGTLRVLGACARPVGGSNQRSAQIELWACNPNDASQQWRAGTDGSLVNKASGYCLDIPGASNASGVRVSLWPCNQQPNQKWGPGLTQPVAGSTQSFTYDAEGLTETVTTGTSTSRYLYGPGGNLLLQKGPDGAVLYLFGGAEQLTLSADGTTVTGNRYYSQPDGTNVIRSSGGAVSYELSNPQHTSTLQVDAATRAVTRRAFDPYGAPRGAGPASWADNRGFLGKPVDANSGLDLLGARNYDAALGRFLSVDPVFQAGDPNQMGGYTYSGDNPIDQSDPSGLNSKSKCNRNSHFGCEISDASDMGQGAKDAGMGWQDYLMAGTAIVVFGTIVAGFSGCEVYSLGVATPECGAGATGAFMGACSFIFVDCGMGGHDEPGPRAPRAPGAKAAVATAEDEKAAAAAYRAEQTARRAEEAAAARRAEAEAAAAAESHSSEPGGVPTTDKAKRPKTSKSSPAAPETPSPKASSPHPAEKTNCSFTAATPVLMADGSAKPIGDLKVGDQVESADQATGMAEGGRAVTAKLTHTDEDLLDLDILVGSTVQTVHTTDNHPFWDDTDHQWVPAGKLPVGHSLKTPSGQQVTVVGVHLVGGRSVMYNLTVAQLHTYYVLAGSTPVLVHNTCPTGLTSPRDVIDAVRGHLASARQQILKSASDGGYSPPTTVSVAYDSATGNIGIGARGDAAGMGGRAGLDPVVTQSMPERSVEPWADVEGCAEVGACQELADQGSRRMSQFFFLTVDTRTGSPMVFCGNCQGTFGKAVDLAPFAAPGERF